jgi:hypothetical protein
MSMVTDRNERLWAPCGRSRAERTELNIGAVIYLLLFVPALLPKTGSAVTRLRSDSKVNLRRLSG